MANPSKQKGTAAETALTLWLRQNGWPDAHRIAGTGSHDSGDVVGPRDVTIEVKNRRMIDLSAFLREAQEEAVNAGNDVGIAWVKKRGTTDPGQWYAVVDGETMALLLKEAGR
jgi:hypothetical protein